MAVRWHVLVIRSFSIVTLLTSQQAQTSSEMCCQVSIAIHRTLSENAEVRVLRVAHRAIRQFYREKVILHKSQVITSEDQIAVIFGQRVVVGAPFVAAEPVQRATDQFGMIRLMWSKNTHPILSSASWLATTRPIR